MSTSRRCCLPTIRARASTISPTCSGSRRCCWRAICRPANGSAPWRSAISKTPPMGEVYRVRQDASQNRHVEGLPLGTVGGMLVKPHAAARRRVRVPGQAVPDQPGRPCAGSSIRSSSKSRVDGDRVHVAAFGGDRGGVGVERESDRRPVTRSTSDSRCACRSRRVRTRSAWRSCEKTRAPEFAPSAVVHRAAPPTPSIFRGIRTSISSSSPVRSGRRAWATRRAAAGSSSAGPAIRRQETRVRAAGSSSTRGAPRVPRRFDRCRYAVVAGLLRSAAAGNGHVRRRHRARAAPRPGQSEVRLPR